MSITQTQQVIETEREDSLSYNSLGNSIFLSHEEIIELLPLFKEECVYMREAYLKNGELHCSFDTFDYPFSKEPTKHLTRTHALLFVTQASYLHAAIFQQYNPKWPLNKTEAVSLAVSEQMTFTNIQLNFRHFIKNTDGIELNLSFPDFRIISNRLFVSVDFSFPKGCYGKCKGMVSLDCSMQPG